MNVLSTLVFEKIVERFGGGFDGQLYPEIPPVHPRYIHLPVRKVLSESIVVICALPIEKRQTN